MFGATSVAAITSVVARPPAGLAAGAAAAAGALVGAPAAGADVGAGAGGAEEQALSTDRPSGSPAPTSSTRRRKVRRDRERREEKEAVDAASRSGMKGGPPSIGSARGCRVSTTRAAVER